MQFVIFADPEAVPLKSYIHPLNIPTIHPPFFKAYSNFPSSMRKTIVPIILESGLVDTVEGGDELIPVNGRDGLELLRAWCKENRKHRCEPFLQSIVSVLSRNPSCPAYLINENLILDFF